MIHGFFYVMGFYPAIMDGVTLSTTSDVSNIFLIFHETTKRAADKNQPELNINFMRLQDIQISFTSSDVLEILQEPIKALKIFP